MSNPPTDPTPASPEECRIPTLRTGHAHPHPQPLSGSPYSAVELMPGDRAVVLMDQRQLPRTEKYEILTNSSQMVDAISSMQVRGAPAIGVAAAYGMVLAAAAADGGEAAFRQAMDGAQARLRASRPTAKNLAWALDRVMALVPGIANESPHDRLCKVAALARSIHQAEVAACKALSAFGAELVPDGATIMTICNAGGLATGGYGTALGVIRAAHEQGKRVRVIACETRPLLQGARLTAWELVRSKIPVEVITDNMAASLFGAKEIDLVVTGADRIARSGDVANKIGTYGLACLASMHGIPFDVAAPWSTVDLETESGSGIPIERRSDDEVTHFGGTGSASRVVAEGAKVRNPAFDVTPARLIRAIHTERGTVKPVTAEGLSALAQR